MTVFRRSKISTIKRKPFAVLFCENKLTERRVGSQGHRHPALQKPGLVIAMQGRRLVATTLVCKSDLSVAKHSGEIDGSDPRLKTFIDISVGYSQKCRVGTPGRAGPGPGTDPIPVEQPSRGDPVNVSTH